MTYVGVGVNIAVRVGQNQHVNVHVVQKGGHGSICPVVSGNLRRKDDTDFVVMLKNKSSRSHNKSSCRKRKTLYRKLQRQFKHH